MKRAKVFKSFEVGQQVQWNWMGRSVYGKIRKVFRKPVARVFRGSVFRRNGSEEIPAYWIISAAGSDVIKSHSELKSIPRR